MYYPSKSLVVVAGMKNRMNTQNQHRRMQFFNFLLICLEQVIRSYCHTLSGYCDLTVTHFQDTVIFVWEEKHLYDFLNILLNHLHKPQSYTTIFDTICLKSDDSVQKVR